jgi:replication factor C large subunit
MAARYDLDEGEVSFVTGSGKSTKKVESIVEEAQQRREDEIEEHAGGAFVPGDTEADDAEAEGSGDDGSEEDDEPTGLAAFGGDDGSDETGSDGEDDPTVMVAERDETEDESDAGDEDPVDRAEDAEDDDQQSGLSDFM